MKRPERSQVLLLGGAEVERDALLERGLKATPIDLDDLNDDNRNGSCGVLLAPVPGKFNLIREYFEKHFFRSCELGLITALCCKEKKALAVQIRNEAYRRCGLYAEITDLTERERKFDALPWVYLADDIVKIAETLAWHDPGPRLGTARIDKIGKAKELVPETETILKRAFHDCNCITIEALTGGKTATETFRVLANLTSAEYGPQPMPFFIKFGSPEAIRKEKLNYRDRAEQFIPFHLRPALNDVRSVTTLTSAALVCNFVESAIPLREALRTGQAGGALFSLFEVTLRGLRSHTLKTEQKAGVLQTFIEERVGAHEIDQNNPGVTVHLRELGISRTPIEIEATLKAHAAKISARQGTYHGDLHAGNIMVRNRDAIVIDFGSMRDFGPLSADPAILEVSLVFGTDEHDASTSFKRWREFVDHIFVDWLNPPLPIEGYSEFAWLYKAVRELRHVVTCCGIEKREAQIVLAACMLRFGRLSPVGLKNKGLRTLEAKRRAYAIVIADRLCRKLDETHETC